MSVWVAFAAYSARSCCQSFLCLRPITISASRRAQCSSWRRLINCSNGPFPTFKGQWHCCGILTAGQYLCAVFSSVGRFSDVITAYDALDLNQLITVIDDRNSAERFVIGCEPGLTTRFTRYLCDAVSNALETIPGCLISRSGRTRLPFLLIRKKVPDVVVLFVPNCAIVLAGELKPCWTVFLDNYPISAGQGTTIPLQPHLAQLMDYMRCCRWKYGFLSTYRHTVFIRRTDDFRFEMSLPIHESQRTLVSGNVFRYNECQGFPAQKLNSSSLPYVQASDRPSSGRHDIATGGDFTINATTVLFGPGGIAKHWVNCDRLVREITDKAIYYVIWDGLPTIPKYYSPSSFSMFRIG